jgi:hypothetical protein
MSLNDTPHCTLRLANIRKLGNSKHCGDVSRREYSHPAERRLTHEIWYINMLQSSNLALGIYMQKKATYQ